MNRKFTKGNIVVLKSGGPEMTVEDYKIYTADDLSTKQSDSQVVCVWFDSENVLQRKIFDQDVLDLEE